MPDPLLETEQVGQVVVLRPSGTGDLTAAEAPAFRVEAEMALAGAHRAVVDLGSVEFVDSSGLAALVGLHRALAARGGELRLSSLRRDVQAVVELARLHRLFEIYDTAEEAITDFETTW